MYHQWEETAFRHGGAQINFETEKRRVTCFLKLTVLITYFRFFYLTVLVRVLFLLIRPWEKFKDPSKGGDLNLSQPTNFLPHSDGRSPMYLLVVWGTQVLGLDLLERFSVEIKIFVGELCSKLTVVVRLKELVSLL